jgi:GcrA cell cycle regulator
MSWDHERVEKLKILWQEGRSASQIAKELGDGVSRNAVIGKIHRLGLSDRTNVKKVEQGKILKNSADHSTVSKKSKKNITNEIDTSNEINHSLINKNKQSQANKKSATNAGDKVTKNSEADDFEGELANSNEDEHINIQNSEIDANAFATMKELEKKAKKLTLMELTERTCKWPIGDPATDQFWFCGHPSESGKPYCDTHVSIAFQPVSSRRDRKQK